MNTKPVIIGVLLIGLALMGAYSFGLFGKQEALPQTQNTTANSVTETDSWQEQRVDEIGLAFKMPPGTTFRKEGDVSHTIGFYVENNDKDKPYMLYAVYQTNNETTEADLEKAKTEMDTSTIKDASIGGYNGIEGLILGEKTRYITTVIKDGKLFSVSTIPPTQENKELTDKIVSTFNFQ